MDLNSYLRTQGESRPKFARRIGCSVPAVTKWVRGERMPRPGQLSKIAAATNGLVTPNDFPVLNRQSVEEIEAKARELEVMAEGAVEHARELRRYAALRKAAA